MQTLFVEDIPAYRNHGAICFGYVQVYEVIVAVLVWWTLHACAADQRCVSVVFTAELPCVEFTADSVVLTAKYGI